VSIIGSPGSFRALRARVRASMRLSIAIGFALMLPLQIDAQPTRAGGDRGRGAGQPGQPGQRAMMERRVEARVNEVMRTRLNLNDEQFKQLQSLSVRMERERRQLRRDEMAAGAELRQQLLNTATPNETRIAELLEQLPRLERRRIDMLEMEQRELAKFLAPSQRARYLAWQDDIRRNLLDVQRRRMDGGPDGGPSGRRQPPPPPR
jgi:periplasmic protein CpxP/Spy